jgi:hypothetical protein
MTLSEMDRDKMKSVNFSLFSSDQPDIQRRDELARTLLGYLATGESM